MEGPAAGIGTKELQVRIQEVQKHTDPTDPDPEHCMVLLD
jgi:hypothetical protein